MGREAFLQRVWAWKAELGGAIVQQLKRLGASCDWSRERFTLDEGLSRAVSKVFVQLYREGLIYKDKRLVNWDPKFQTAISDLEVVQVECRGSFKWSRDDGTPFDGAALGKILARNPNGHLYYFDYPVVDSDGEETGQRVTVATTRPETMLGDSAVAVHPDDERYRHLIGRQVRLPLVGRLMTIVGDEYSDPEKGTGAVKITPAHDFNDFEVGKRHEAEGARPINILDAGAKVILKDNLAFFEGVESDHDHARLLAAVDGQDRFVARLRIVEMMALAGLLAKIEPHTHMVPHADRSNAVVEPWLTDQWYVDAKTLAEPAIAAVREGRTQFVPKSWEKTYYDWLENIQPWCVSRQLWWGHQIPAWYSPWGGVFVEETEDAAYAAALADGVERGVLSDDEARAIAGRTGEAGGDVQARRGRARHLVFFGALAVLDARLAGRNARAEAVLSDRRPGDRFRHHLLLGRADDDDGPAFPKRDPVPRRLHPRPRARREGGKNVEVERERHRPDRHHRSLRRRRFAIYSRRNGGPGARYQALAIARRRLSEFRNQALERLPLRGDERLCARGRLRSGCGARAPQPLDSRRSRQGVGRDSRSD